MEKINCIICGLSKELSEFHNCNKCKNKHVSKCKVCVKEYQDNRKDVKQQYDKKYRELNKPKIDERISNYVKLNQEKTRIRKLKWYRENSKSINERISNRKKSDPIFKLTTLYRSKINKILGSKREKSFDLIGCTPQELKTHIENKFTEGMCWENHGTFGWHIDHIIPLSSANNDEELKKLCHYTNLQPLWWEDNLKKRDFVPF
jgi:hypothetical protein